jgi:pimeloyl-ACP methyl ester carboxylesterase
MITSVQLLFSLLATLPAAFSSPLTIRNNSPGSSIQWGPCGNASLIPSSLQCGKLVVPLDHNNPPSPSDYNDSNTVTLGMSRLSAPGDGPHPSLIINPGGPGGVAWVTLLLQLQAESRGAENGIVSKAIRQKYDLIGLDPRGVGLSQNIKCKDSLFDSKPDVVFNNQGDYDKLAEWNKVYAESCEELSGDIVKYVDTKSVAKDFELVRQVSHHTRIVQERTRV